MTRSLRRAFTVLALVAVVLGVAPAVAADDGAVVLDPPSAVVRFGTSITWSTSFTSAEAPVRVELLSRLQGTESWFVREVAAVKTGQSTTGRATYSAEFADVGSYLPNGAVQYRFRVTTSSGPVAGPGASVLIADDRVTWKVIEGNLVRLHWYQGSEDFARRALRIGEDAVASASKLLGVAETEPIDFFVYADPALLQSALGPGTKEFIGGRAVATIRTLFGAVAPGQIGSDWVPVLITHELTHLVFDTATRNAFHAPPHWLNEGLATYLSEGYEALDRQRVANAIVRGTLLPLQALAFGFPQARKELFYLGYAEGTAAVDFFIRTYGEPKLVQLIRSYADGVTDDEAFSAATGGGMAAFAAAWLADAGANAPQAYGPRPAAPGPTPTDWVPAGPTATPVPTDDGGAATPSATPTPGSDAPGSGFETGVAIGFAGAGLVAAAVIVIMLRGRRGSRSRGLPPADRDGGP